MSDQDDAIRAGALTEFPNGGDVTAHNGPGADYIEGLRRDTEQVLARPMDGDTFNAAFLCGRAWQRVNARLPAPASAPVAIIEIPDPSLDEMGGLDESRDYQRGFIAGIKRSRITARVNAPPPAPVAPDMSPEDAARLVTIRKGIVNLRPYLPEFAWSCNAVDFLLVLLTEAHARLAEAHGELGKARDEIEKREIMIVGILNPLINAEVARLDADSAALRGEYKFARAHGSPIVTQRDKIVEDAVQTALIHTARADGQHNHDVLERCAGLAAMRSYDRLYALRAQAGATGTVELTKEERENAQSSAWDFWRHNRDRIKAWNELMEATWKAYEDATLAIINRRTRPAASAGRHAAAIRAQPWATEMVESPAPTPDDDALIQECVRAAWEALPLTSPAWNMDQDELDILETSFRAAVRQALARRPVV